MGHTLPPMVAIHGFKRSGKGTIATRLVEAHGFEVLKFAGPLKAMSAEVLRLAGYSPAIIDRCIESDLKEVPLPGLGGITPRRLMQVVGSEFRLAFAGNVWNNVFMARQDHMRRVRGQRVCVDDFRFPHEDVLLSACRAEKWLVERPVIPPEATPDDIDDVLSSVTRRLAFDHSVLHALMAVFRTECLIPDGTSIDEPLRVLDYACLRDVWAALNRLESMLMEPVKVGAVHQSEMGLPASLFSVHYVNDGTVKALHDKVDDNLTVVVRLSLALPADPVM